jgi:hypothetical protein
VITGECPYCSEIIFNHMPDRTPAYSKNTCDHCKKEYWMEYSRIDSNAWTIEGFENAFDINHETKIIKRKNDQQTM